MRIRIPTQTRFQRHVLNRFTGSGVGVGSGSGSGVGIGSVSGRDNLTTNATMDDSDQQQGSDEGRESDVGASKGGAATGAGGPYYGNYSAPGQGLAPEPGIAPGQGFGHRQRHRSSSCMGMYDEDGDVNDDKYSNVVDDSWSLHSRHRHHSDSDASSHHHRVNFELNRADSFGPATGSKERPSEVYNCYYDPHTQQYYPTIQQPNSHTTQHLPTANNSSSTTRSPHRPDANDSDRDSVHPDPSRFFRALSASGGGAAGKGRSQGSQEGQGQGQGHGQGQEERQPLQSPLKLLHAHATNQQRSFSSHHPGGGVEVGGGVRGGPDSTASPRYRQSPSNAALELLRNGNNSKVCHLDHFSSSNPTKTHLH